MALDVDKLRRLWDEFVPIAGIAVQMQISQDRAKLALNRLGVSYKVRCLHGHDLRIPGSTGRHHRCKTCNRAQNRKSYVRDRGIDRTAAQVRCNEIQRLLFSMISKIDTMPAWELAEWRQREAKLLTERDGLARKYAVSFA